MKTRLVVIAFVILAFLTSSGQASDQRPRAQPGPFVWSLMGLKASRAARKLKVLLGDGSDVEITIDDETDTLFLKGQPERIREAEAILKWMDKPPANYLTMTPLKHANAEKAAQRLRVLLILVAVVVGEDIAFRVTPSRHGNDGIIFISGGRETREWGVRIARRLDLPGW